MAATSNFVTIVHFADLSSHPPLGEQVQSPGDRGRTGRGFKGGKFT